MSKKIKILFRPSDLAGVGHFRSIWPAQHIQKKYSDKFDVKINNSPDYNDIESLKKYDIIHFHREFGPQDKMDNLFKELRGAGVKIVMDIDDYWSPPKSHPLYQAAKSDGLTEKIVNTIKKVDYVTTTTNIFAEEIKRYNKNVLVIPNAIDPDHKMWKDEEVEKGDKLRISWIGGSSHLHDLELMRDSISKLNSDRSIKDMYQIILCGFDTRGSVTMIDRNGQRKTRKIEPHESVWTKFEEIFTTNYSIVDEDYKKHLKEFKNKDYKGQNYNDLNYVRRWTLPLTKYGKHYNYSDVCLAPLQENTFNKVKSELKIIEAGMKKKVLIAQDFGIYNELLEHGETGFLVPKTKNHKNWYKHMKHLINNRDEVERISNNLYNFVKDKYNMSKVTGDRVKMYEQLLKGKEENKIKAEVVD